MKIPTGIKGLDKMLFGGIVQGRNVLISGPCGSGKSILGMQFLYTGATVSNEPGMYITLEETKEKLCNDMQKFGMDITNAEKTGNLTLIGGPMARLRKYMDKVDANISNLIEEMEEVIKEKGIKRVVIDSVNLLTMLCKTEDERRKALAMISNSLSALGCTSLLISETKEGSMDLSRYGIEEFVVDGVIVLYLMRQGSKFVPGITIRKMRGTNHDKEIRFFQITDKGMEVYTTEPVFTNIR
jgi:KaiC/GvpD/RAD55 family RecA-like ATPase